MSGLINEGLNDKPQGSEAAKGAASTVVKKQLASSTGAAAAKGAVSSAGGPAGVALFVASNLPWQKIIILLIVVILGIGSLVAALPGALFNSIFHFNEFHNPPPENTMQMKRELYQKELIYEQENKSFVIIKDVLNEAYLNSRDNIRLMSKKLGLDHEKTMSHLVDSTVGGEETETDAEQGPVVNTIFNNEYTYVAILSAYSVSINNLKPKRDAYGVHIPQPFELDKNCETDIKDKIRKYYKNSDDKPHGNNVYRISYYGEEENGTPTIFDDPEYRTNEDGSVTVIHHYYVKPTIHNVDTQKVCSDAFEMDMDAHYEAGASNTTNMEATTTITLNHLAMLYDMSGGIGVYLGGTLSDAEIAKVLSWVKTQYPGLTPARMSVINIGLQSVGKIPYFLSGHADDGPYLSRKWGQMRRQTYSPDKSNVGQMIPYGLDCGSFVGWVYGAARVTEKYMCSVNNYKCSNHWGTTRYGNDTQQISQSQLLPGDIILKTRASSGQSFGHIGIYVCRDDSGEPIILHCRTGKNGGAVLEKRSVIDSKSNAYSWRRLPIDYEALKNNKFPKTLTYNKDLRSYLQSITHNLTEDAQKQNPGGHKY